MRGLGLGLGGVWGHSSSEKARKLGFLRRLMLQSSLHGQVLMGGHGSGHVRCKYIHLE